MQLTMTLKPRISEKAYGLSQAKNVYVFDVPTDANKVSIASAVAAQFKVNVTEVNIANVRGKTKRTVRRGGRVSLGKRRDSKKAYVTLKAGDSIPIFAAEEQAAKDAEKASKKEKK